MPFIFLRCLNLLSFSLYRVPARLIGHAELLTEASLVDLSHGGKNSVSEAHTLLNKVRHPS
jgi:hypothetical protein